MYVTIRSAYRVSKKETGATVAQGSLVVEERGLKVAVPFIVWMRAENGAISTMPKLCSTYTAPGKGKDGGDAEKISWNTPHVVCENGETEAKKIAAMIPTTLCLELVDELDENVELTLKEEADGWSETSRRTLQVLNAQTNKIVDKLTKRFEAELAKARAGKKDGKKGTPTPNLPKELQKRLAQQGR